MQLRVCPTTHSKSEQPVPGVLSGDRPARGRWIDSCHFGDLNGDLTRQCVIGDIHNRSEAGPACQSESPKHRHRHVRQRLHPAQTRNREGLSRL